MKETAKNALGKMLQKKLPADDIVHTVLEFHKANDLCIVPDEEDFSPREARIICSMGMASSHPSKTGGTGGTGETGACPNRPSRPSAASPSSLSSPASPPRRP